MRQEQQGSQKKTEQQGGDAKKTKQQQAGGPDNPSKHSMKQPVNQEPHRESGQGRHEPSP